MNDPTTLPRINSIIVEAREWFRKVNGNSYFSARIYTTEIQDGKTVTNDPINLPFQYGHGDYYLRFAVEELVKLRHLPSDNGRLTWYCRATGDVNRGLIWYCRQSKILFHSTISPALKRDVVAFGKGKGENKRAEWKRMGNLSVPVVRSR